MQFVHLAPRHALSRIRRTGLRLGGGRRGRGVYAVPLFKVSRVSAKDWDDLDSGEDQSVPTSSVGLWRHLFDKPSRRGRRPVAVIFELPDHCWPLDVYLSIAPDQGGRMLKALQGCDERGVEISAPELRALSQAASERTLTDLESTAHRPASLGFLIRSYITSGAAVWSWHDDSIEIVIRTPVPPTCIRRLVALSQTNAEAKKRRERERGRIDADYVF